MYRNDVTETQFKALIADLEGRGFDARGSTLATLPALIDRLNAELGYATAREALVHADIPRCEMCFRDSRATPAVVYAEVNTGSRSIEVLMNVCEACVPRVRALPPPPIEE